MASSPRAQTGLVGIPCARYTESTKELCDKQMDAVNLCSSSVSHRSLLGLPQKSPRLQALSLRHLTLQPHPGSTTDLPHTSLQASAQAAPPPQHILPPSNCLFKPPSTPKSFRVQLGHHRLQEAYGAAGFLTPTSLHTQESIRCLCQGPLAKELDFSSQAMGKARLDSLK